MENDKLVQAILGSVPAETKKKLTGIIQNLGTHRRPGESNLDLVSRLTAGGPMSIETLAKAAAVGPVQQAPQAAPGPAPPADPAPQVQAQPGPAPVPVPAPPVEAPTVPTYRFKTLDDMVAAMTEIGDHQWQIRAGTGLQHILGVTPANPDTQTKMHRVYLSNSNDTMEGIVIPMPHGMPSKTLTFNRLMIEPV